MEGKPGRRITGREGRKEGREEGNESCETHSEHSAFFCAELFFPPLRLASPLQLAHSASRPVLLLLLLAPRKIAPAQITRPRRPRSSSVRPSPPFIHSASDESRVRHAKRLTPNCEQSPLFRSAPARRARCTSLGCRATRRRGYLSVADSDLDYLERPGDRGREGGREGASARPRHAPVKNLPFPFLRFPLGRLPVRSFLWWPNERALTQSGGRSYIISQRFTHSQRRSLADGGTR